MRIQQRDVKTPSFNAYAQDVMKTGGYPTKQFEDYSNLDPVGSGPKQLPSAGGGLGGLLGRITEIDRGIDITKKSFKDHTI